MSLILTFDLGTTYFKACLFDEAGRIVASRRLAPPLDSTNNNTRCELSAKAFRHTLIGMVQDLAKDPSVDLSQVIATSFATQANSFLLLDHDGDALTSIILWTDERACPADPVIDSLSGLTDYYRVTGVPTIDGHFMAAKLLWLRRHQPNIWHQTARICSISDYLTFWMTGQHATEAGVAALTGLVDAHRLNWWPQALEHLDLQDRGLPRIVRAGTDLGAIRSEVAGSLGLPVDCRFIVGCLDQYAGAIGAGNVTSGGISETTGTVLATVMCSNRMGDRTAPGVFQGPGYDDLTWFQMVFGSTSANLLEAFRNRLAVKPDYEALCTLAAQVPAGADGLRIDASHPSGGDEMFCGLTARHTDGHKVRAILEAVAFALSDQVKDLCGDTRPASIRSVGGAAQSNLWLQIKADVLGVPVYAIACQEPTSLGAAILAASSIRNIKPAGLANEWVGIRTISHPTLEHGYEQS